MKDNMKSIGLGLFGCLWLLDLLAWAGPLDTWYWRNPLPQGNPLYGVCHGAGQFVAVGKLGSIMTSPDGRNWIAQVSGTDLDLHDVCFGNGTYVAVGDLGIIMTSSDGKHWVEQYTEWFYHLKAVTWGGGKFVGVGENSIILVSTNGMDWSLEAIGSGTLFDITFGDGLFVVVGGSLKGSGTWQMSNSSTNMVLTSKDGFRWDRRTLPNYGCLTAVGYRQDTFVAAAYDSPYGEFSSLIYSTDALHWVPATMQYYSHAPISAICATSNAWFAFNGGTFITAYAMYGSCLRSESGRDWVNDYLPASMLESAAASENTVVAVGTTWNYTQPGRICVRSPSGTWEDVVYGLEFFNCERIKNLDGKFVGLCTPTDPALGQAVTRVAVSTNGAAWSSALVANNLGFNDLNYGNGLYVAVGNGGLIATATNIFKWTIQDTGITNDLTSITIGNGIFVATTPTGAVYRSTSGEIWMPQEVSESSPLGRVAFGNGLFLLPDGGDGSLWSSPDGIAWQNHFLGTNLWMSAVSFWQDRFIGIDSQGNFLVSTNGLVWKRIWPHQYGYDVAMVGYSDGLYVLVGGRFYGKPSNFLLTSVDGINWESNETRASYPISSLAFGNNTVVTTLMLGGIMQSAPLCEMAPQLAIPPTSVAVRPGQPVSLTATPISSQPVSYQWFMDGAPISNPNESILVITNLSEGERHEYSVVISNALGTVTSPPARVVFGVPARLAVENVSTAQLLIEGTAGLNYQLEYLDGQPGPYGWQVLTNIQLVSRMVTAIDPIPANTNRFYRAKLIP